MPQEAIHRFELNGGRFAIDPETCFCFECDDICWDVLEYYPYTTVNRILSELSGKHPEKEIIEVIGELEWLRASKSILPALNPEDIPRQFEIERGVKRLTVSLSRKAPETTAKKRGWFGQAAPVVSNTARQMGMDAVSLLLNRAGEQKQLDLEFLEEGYVYNPELIAELCAHALRAARLAGKDLTASVRIAGLTLDSPPEALQGHHISARLEFSDPAAVADHVRPFTKPGAFSLSRLVKALQPKSEGVVGRIIARPGHPGFGGVVEALDKAGFQIIELDFDGAYIANPSLDPFDMLDGLSKSAVYYAECLLAGRCFRLDPIASLFYRIHEGSPVRRIDPAGTNELAVDGEGNVYPSWRMFGMERFAHGSLPGGTIDDVALNRFEDIGVVTTSQCRPCWARHLCGGGCVAVHHVLTDSFHKPHDGWCEAQRAWMSAAVSAFNALSSQGVNFSRLYHTVTHAGRAGGMSVLGVLRAVFGMTIGMRPIEESDADILVRWENWSDTAYFLFNESGMLLATKYDREMDSLHPKGMDQEFVLTRPKRGEPFGLVKIRPDRLPGVAQLSLFMRNPADYASEDVRKGFRFLLKQAFAQQSLRRFTASAAQNEQALHAFLHAVGFAKAGIQREALYIHGAYRDIHIYTMDAAAVQ